MLVQERQEMFAQGHTNIGALGRGVRNFRRHQHRVEMVNAVGESRLGAQFDAFDAYRL